MLKSFSAKNFRCFKELRLERLGQINLIAGKNNVGKTALLEAILLHLAPTEPSLIPGLNAFRGLRRSELDGEKAWGWFFFGKQSETPVELRAVLEDGTERCLSLTLAKADEYPLIEEGGRLRGAGRSGPGLMIRTAGGELVMKYGDSKGRTCTTVGRPVRDPASGEMRMVRTYLGAAGEIPSPPAILIHPQAALHEDAERLNTLIVEKREGELVQGLKCVEPNLEGLVPGTYAGETTVLADLGFRERIPLPLVGDGTVRLFRYLVGMASFRGGVALIDEVENGFHHSAMEKVWRTLGQAATRRQVQLFATTHSWECIRAAYEAFKGTQMGFFLHRLERMGEDVSAITLDRENIETALNCELEVR